MSAAVALTANLNACRHSVLSPEVAARAVIGDHTAHHVIDEQGVLGLDPLAANELDSAIAAALRFVDSDWILAVPRPGRLAPLAGPPAVNTAALAAGVVVLPASGGPAWIPQAVGPAVQWSISHAAAPKPMPDPAEMDRNLRQVVLLAGRRLADLPLGTTDRPESDGPPELPACFGSRAERSLARAWSLMHAMEAALVDDGDTLHVHAIEARRQALNEVRNAAVDSLCAVVSWRGLERR